MRALVIEYFDEDELERRERRRFWEGLQKRWEGTLDIILSHQLQDMKLRARGEPFDLQAYDLLFIHFNDMNYSTDHNYVDLAKSQEKPFVCYSGGATALEAPRLERCQIEEIPLAKLRTNIELFLEDVTKRETLCPESFYLLAGIDPRLEAALDLLYLFLPLDLELQMKDGDQYVEKCKARACELHRQNAEIERLVTKALRLERGPDPEAIEADAKNGKGTVPLLKTLLTHVERICTQDVNTALLSEILGFDREISEELGDVQLTGDNAGFHRTYQDFRDQLLASVGSNQGYGR